MNWFRKKKYRFVAAVICAIVIGVFGQPGETVFSSQKGETEKRNVLGWWGTIYPEFCFMGDKNTKGKPRIHFWLGENLKEYLEIWFA